MSFEHLFMDSVEIDMPSDFSDWIDKAMENSGIELRAFEMLDIMFADQEVVYDAMMSGNKIYLCLAIQRLRSFVNLKGSPEGWVTFAEKCLAKMQEMHPEETGKATNVTKPADWLDVITNRGTATYQRGKLDFTRGEGGNNHIYVFDNFGDEMGYIWLDTHCSGYGFCGKSSGSCRGLFAEAVERLDPERWANHSMLFDITKEQFSEVMNYVIARLR